MKIDPKSAAVKTKSGEEKEKEKEKEKEQEKEKGHSDAESSNETETMEAGSGQEGDEPEAIFSEGIDIEDNTLWEFMEEQFVTDSSFALGHQALPQTPDIQIGTGDDVILSETQAQTETLKEPSLTEPAQTEQQTSTQTETPKEPTKEPSPTKPLQTESPLKTPSSPHPTPSTHSIHVGSPSHAPTKEEIREQIDILFSEELIKKFSEFFVLKSDVEPIKAKLNSVDQNVMKMMEVLTEEKMSARNKTLVADVVAPVFDEKSASLA